MEGMYDVLPLRVDDEGDDVDAAHLTFADITSGHVS